MSQSENNLKKSRLDSNIIVKNPTERHTELTST